MPSSSSTVPRTATWSKILAVVEADANEVFSRLVSPFHRPRPLTKLEEMWVATYLAMQVMRTPRHRREED